MKLTNILVTLTIGFTILWNCTGCSKESDVIEINNPDNVNNEIDKAVDKICLKWNTSKSEIDSQMKGFEKTAEDQDFVSYKASKGNYKIAYDFVDGGLRSSVVVIPTSVELDKSTVYSLEGYIYVGEIDGTSIYANSNEGNMAMIMNREIDNAEYLTVGFAPIESDLFETIEPISFSNIESVEVTTNSMTVTWSVTGNWNESFERSGVIYSTSIDMSEIKNQTASNNGTGTFSLKLTGLTVNTTYYYSVYIVVDGVRYDSEVFTQELEPVKTYAVGDFWPNTSNPEGVVCEITGSGEHGVMLSLDQDYLQWDTNGLFCTDYKCYNSSDGSKNDMGNTLPFAKWVYNHGAGWYGPARNELIISKGKLQLINSTLKSGGYPEMNGFYWSSTQRNQNESYVTTVTETSYMGYANEYTFYNTKNQNRSVRAMKKF